MCHPDIDFESQCSVVLALLCHWNCGDLSHALLLAVQADIVLAFLLQNHCCVSGFACMRDNEW
jgi:hypothetical protein